jgi:lipopolysaccharide biosynthesis protein
MSRGLLARLRGSAFRPGGRPKNLKPWCFYLPQFHPIPENDAWWGKGFTEWDNVRAAEPLFPGHFQPQEPAGAGYDDYYDLRDPAVLACQAGLARAYGIYGFVFYHYWFSGRRLLETPVANLLATPHLELPFFLCWANESWTRRWDGLDREVLIAQEYSPADDLKHIRNLLPLFRDRRYYKLAGRPLLMVYRSEELPDPEATAQRWRSEVRKAGFPDLYLLRVEGFQGEIDPGEHGFDAAVEFAPDWRCLTRRVYLDAAGKWCESPDGAHPGTTANRVFLYDEVAAAMQAKPEPGYRRYPGVFPAWDNSARRRRGGATIIHGASPEIFQSFFQAAAARTAAFAADERFVFINAWNEWGEGCHLEPDRQHGRAFLEALRLRPGRKT